MEECEWDHQKGNHRQTSACSLSLSGREPVMLNGEPIQNVWRYVSCICRGIRICGGNVSECAVECYSCGCLPARAAHGLIRCRTYTHGVDAVRNGHHSWVSGAVAAWDGQWSTDERSTAYVSLSLPITPSTVCYHPAKHNSVLLSGPMRSSP
ncbi:hypothetical protein BC628DRAFT_928652 [Trametes gibbosa]|nr:hypothetical protein BC628DRAFT_928652 [Trametes gibbosa]